jgi:excinuclease ABC subunit A
VNDKIIVKGARQHNLKDVTLEIPKNNLVVITGISGSGKSTLAFDTIYAEGQRRYVESLSAYARQFLEMMDKPDVDSIEGLSPAISIQQKTTSKNPRSTVGTVTEVYDYLRLLFARVGIPHCHKCGNMITTQSADSIVDDILRNFEGQNIIILAPIIEAKKGTYKKLFAELRQKGFARIRLNGEVIKLSSGNLKGDLPKLNRYKKHTVEVVVDRLKPTIVDRGRLFDSIKTALNTSEGVAKVVGEKKETVYSQRNACLTCKLSLPDLEPRSC